MLFIQAGRILHDFFLCDFFSTELENSPHFLNLCIIFWFNMVWYRWSVATLRLADSDVTVTPLVMCMGWLHWWYNYTAHIVSSSKTLAFLTNVHEKHKSTLPSTIQVKNQWRIIGIDWKLDVISWHVKGEWILDILHSVKTRS